MVFCTPAEVNNAINFPLIGSPVSDDVIVEFIKYSETEVEELYNTKFGNIEDSGTADVTSTVSQLDDSSKSWASNLYDNYVIKIVSGTGSGQYREIVNTTPTGLSVSPDFDTAPDDTSVYKILKLGSVTSVLDGNNHNFMFLKKQPLVKLNSLSIGGVDVTVSKVYEYQEEGRIVLSRDAEQTRFKNNELQNIELSYIYGVEKYPNIIKRLVILLSAMKVVASRVSGSYTDYATISLPGGLNASKGVPYINLQAGIREMKAEVADIQKRYTPFTYFG